MKVIFLVSVFSSAFALSFGASYVCNEVAHSWIYKEGGLGTFSIFEIISLKSTNATNLLTVSNVHGLFTTASGTNLFPNAVCAYADDNRSTRNANQKPDAHKNSAKRMLLKRKTSNAATKCIYDLTLPFTYSRAFIGVYPYVNFPDATPFQPTVYAQSADDGTFHFDDGSIPDFDNRCFTHGYNISRYFSNETTCCTSFIPAPQILSGNPKCTVFKSVVSLLDLDNNHSIFATSTAFYTLDDQNMLNVTGNFTGPSDFAVEYQLAKDSFCSTAPNVTSFNCSLQLPRHSDSKVVVVPTFYQYIGDDGYGAYVPKMGRILLRGGQTLMKEGVPYTPSNNCDYYSYNYPNFDKNLVLTSQFCCNTFAA